MTEAKYNAFNELSDELKSEFLTCFKETLDELDNCFDSLNCSYNEERVNEMFRAVHSLKGNCHLVFLDDVADLCHKLEEIVSEFRSGKASYTPACGEFITFVFLRLEQLIESVITDRAVSDAEVKVLHTALDKVLHAEGEARDKVIQKTMESMAGVLVANRDISEQVLDKLDTQEVSTEFSPLEFMAKVSDTLQSRSLSLSGQQQNLLDLCLAANHHLSHPVSDEQLTAAFQLQYLGRRLVSSPVPLVENNLAEWEMEKAVEQLGFAAGFLKLSDHWLSAARMIEQSMEHFDGSGFPLGLAADAIDNGAQILSMERLYQYSLSSHGEQGRKKAVAKSLATISSEKGKRFSPEAVDCFSRAVLESWQEES